VRYSPDLKHWSSWQCLQRAEAQSNEEKKNPGRYYSGTIRVPCRERSEYGRLLSQYSTLDVPWKSDEEAAVRWMLERDPESFSKQIPFIGYIEFLFEGGFHGGQRIQSLRAEVSYAMGGMHCTPRDAAVYTTVIRPGATHSRGRMNKGARVRAIRRVPERRLTCGC
jgi:hypothetical protein